MIRQLILRSVKSLVSIQLGQSKIRKFIPPRVFKQLKVYKYNFWLMYAALGRNSSFGPIQLIRYLRQDRKRILFYPDIPWETSKVTLVCLYNGYQITNDINGNFDVAFTWKDATFYQPDPSLTRLAETREVINFHCNDISKKSVDAAFKEVFGYCTFIDPRTYVGKCVQKSDLNAKHDGRIVECPIQEIDPGCIYQIIIDNQIDEDCLLVIRTTIYKGTIPFLHILHKVVEHRFTEHVLSRQLVTQVSQFLSEEEQNQIILFCKLFGMDYGALDVLRDRRDGRIYIIDANNTPDGDYVQFEEDREDLAFEAKIFENTFVAS